MKILRGGIRVGSRKERLQGFSRCIDERTIDYIELPIGFKLLPGRGIEDLHRAAIFIGRGGKIPGPFRECGHGGKRVVGRAAAVAVPAGEEKPLVAAVENLWNVQPTAEKGAKARQVVAGPPS